MLPYIQKLVNKYTLEQTKNSVKDVVKPVFFKLNLRHSINKSQEVPSEYRSSWKKLLSDPKKSEGILVNLIRAIYGKYNGRLTFLYDLGTNELAPKGVSMIFAGTPSKKHQVELIKVLRVALGPGYRVELFNSDETSNKEVETKAKNIIKEAKENGQKVVFVSKDMASRSFSIPEIDTIILMFDRGSYAAVSQKISRVLTPGKTFNGEEKVVGNIISLSLNPNRDDLCPIDEYVIFESEKVKVAELSDGVRRVLRSIDLFTNDENGLIVPIEIDLYGIKLIQSSSLIRLGKSTCNPELILIDDKLVKSLLGINITKTKIDNEELEGIDLSSVKIFAEENKPQNTNKIEKELSDNSLREKLKDIMENIVDNVVEISEINNCESDDIIECLDMIKEKGFDEEVVFEVGINCETVKQIIQLGGVSHKLLNTIITSYNKEENSLLID